jgi:uncharacterized protein YndB with AHSA1/START domain
MKIIRKEIVIDAPAAKVWEHITDPAWIAGWLMPNDFQAVVGKAYSMDCGEMGQIQGAVKELIQQKKLVYSWTSTKIKVETIVTITLNEEKGHTRLTLEHSGWDALPPSEQGIADNFDQGWTEKLQALAEQIASAN